MAQYLGDASSMYVAIHIPNRFFGKQFIHTCEKNEVRLQTASLYCTVEANHIDKLLIVYGYKSLAQIY